MSALSAASLQYRLTEEERRTFNETGVLYVRNALSPEQVEHGIALTERIHEAKLAEGQDPSKALFYPNFIPDDPFLSIWSTTNASCPRYGGFWAGTYSSITHI